MDYGRIGFGAGSGELVTYNQVVFPLNDTSGIVVLPAVAVPGGTGNDIFVRQVVSYQDVNGVQYALKDAYGNAIALLKLAWRKLSHSRLNQP